MKAFFITSQTNETHKHHESFASINGNKVHCYYYNHKGSTSGEAIARMEADISTYLANFPSDLIVYIGSASHNVPSAPFFAKLNKTVAPTVHLCSDAADPPWWPFLEAFDKAGSFSLQVALDGNRDWPLAATQLTALTVVDVKRFPKRPIPHAERPIVFGFAGNVAGSRTQRVGQLASCGLKWRQRDRSGDSYDAYIDYTEDCRITCNFAETGSGTRLHVKGRVIEAGLCGTLLLENALAPTSQWFTPGEDYITYTSMDEVPGIINKYTGQPEETQRIAESLRQKVLKDHAPKMFWQRIFDRIPGLQP